MSDFAAGFQAGLAGVQQFQKIRDNRRKALEEQERKAKLSEIMEAQPTTVQQDTQRGLTSITDDQGRPLIRTTGVNAQGLTTFENLDPTTGQYVSDANNVFAAVPDGQKTMFLGKTYDEPLSAERMQGLRQQAVSDYLIASGDIEQAAKYAESQADIGLKGAQKTRLETQAEIDRTKLAFMPDQVQAELQLTQAQVANLNTKTQNIVDKFNFDVATTERQLAQTDEQIAQGQQRIDLDVEKFGFTQEQFKQEFGRLVQNDLVKNEQFYASLGLDERKLEEVIANNARDFVIAQGKLAQGERGLDLETRAQDRADARLVLNQEEFGHKVKMDAINQVRADKRVELEAARLDLQDRQLGIQSDESQARIRKIEAELTELDRKRNGVELSYLADSIKSGNDETANRVIDDNRDLIMKSLNVQGGADLDVIDKDALGMTVAINDADGNRIGTRFFEFDALDDRANVLQGTPNTKPSVSKLAALRTSLTRQLSDMFEDDPEREQVMQTLASVDASLAQALGTSDPSQVNAALELRQLRLSFRDITPSTATNYSAVVDRNTGGVRVTTAQGAVRNYDSVQAYQDAETSGEVADFTSRNYSPLNTGGLR